MNTQEVKKNLQLVGGGLALLSAAALANGIRKSLNKKTYSRPFNSKMIEEVEGRILEIGHSNEKKDERRGIYLILKTNDEVLMVHLGPAWYVNRRDRRFKIGEEVRIKGSRIDYNGQKALVAISVFKNKKVLRLRDEEGIPYWQGWSKINDQK